MPGATRSLLFVPGARPAIFEKAMGSGADIVCVDLEDAVPPSGKDAARPDGVAWLAGAAAGGLLMGYGARLAYGCNIGAFLGGLTSGSLHGLWWLAWAVAGTWAGLRLRQALRLDPA